MNATCQTCGKRFAPDGGQLPLVFDCMCVFCRGCAIEHEAEHISSIGEEITDIKKQPNMPMQQMMPPPAAQMAAPQPALLTQGQEPLTASALASATNAEQKQMLGERLFPLIQQTHAEQAGKITGMLLEMDNSELLHLLEDVNALNAKTREAVKVLEDHSRSAGQPQP